MTNEAAIGYMIIAAKAALLDEETIELLERLMTSEMDITAEEEAEEAWSNF